MDTLPRDARDTLFLLGVIAWVVAPQVGHLPLWCSLLAAAVLLWRGRLAWTSRPLPGLWWRLGALALAVGATLYTHRTLLGRDAGVTLIVVLLALKTLELRARRDAFVVFFLGFFTMLTNFFFSQSLLTAAAMLVALLGLLTALVNAHMPAGRPPLLRAARTAGWMALLGAPVMAVLFVLFPRMAPLWGVPGDAMGGRSGLSSSMQIGNIASLVLDDSVALRIRFDSPQPPQQELYFRGPVLSTFDGREWKTLRSGFPPRMQPPANLQVSGEPVRYQVTLQPSGKPWIFVLEASPQAPVVPGHELTLTPDLQWLSNQPVTDALRYTARSYPAFSHGPARMTPALQDYVDLPAGYNPRTLQLAANLRRALGYTADASTVVTAVLDRLRTGGYTYTLEPGVTGQHSADEFWFDSKAGFCEHIASAFVVLMRAMDIPARVVTGYQGGDRNPVDGLWTVRQSDAHAWAEVWQAGRGWTRVDPTAALAPGRTGAFERLQAPKGFIASALLATVPTGFALQWRAVWEAVNNRWNQWVLNYSQGRQMDLLKSLGFESPSWSDLSTLLIGMVVFVSLCGAVWTLWDRRQHDPWLRLLLQVTQRLKSDGMRLPDHLPPRTLATLVEQQRGPTAAALATWLRELERQRYARLSDTGRQQLLHRLRQDLARLNWPSPLPDAP